VHNGSLAEGVGVLILFQAGRSRPSPTVRPTSAISGGAQSARRLLTKTFGGRMQFLQAA